MCTEARSSMTSLRRTDEPFKKYSLEASRWISRAIDTSSKSTGNVRSRLSNTITALARFCRSTVFEPLKIRSSVRFPRIDLRDCSPSTNRSASATFDFPEPFGPTIADTCAPNSKTLFRANDLKPDISRLFTRITISLSQIKSS